MDLTKYKQLELTQFDWDYLKDHEFPPNDFHDFSVDILKLEADLITQVLETLLKRKPTIEDFKLTSKVYYYKEKDRYHLVYSNIVLGVVEMPMHEVTMDLEYTSHFTVFKFTPTLNINN